MAEATHTRGSRRTRLRRIAPRPDFTAMAALALSLVVFTGFMPTLNPDRVMMVAMPGDERIPGCFDGSAYLTVILSDNDQIYYYIGAGGEDGKLEPRVTDLDGIRKVLRDQHNPWIQRINAERSRLLTESLSVDEFKLRHKQAVIDINRDPQATFVWIKADDGARFENLIDIIDEIRMVNIAKYAIVDVTKKELELIASLETE